VVSAVRAEAQSRLRKHLETDGLLTDEERDVMRWGGNGPKSAPRGLDMRVYRDATAMEALVGWLWLGGGGGQTRLTEVLQRCWSATPGAGAALK